MADVIVSDEAGQWISSKGGTAVVAIVSCTT
jgi:hypothetical protein